MKQTFRIWNNIAIIKLGIIIFTVFFLYYADFIVLINEAINNESSSHIILIPLLFIYILYVNKKKFYFLSEYFKEYNIKTTFIGIIIILISIILKIYGSYTFSLLEYRLISLPIFIIGSILILFNYKVFKLLLSPILFLFLLIPPPLTYTYLLGSKLSYFTSNVAYFLLKKLNLPITIRNYYGTPTLHLLNSIQNTPISFNIDIACSGVYTLIGFTVFSIFLSYIYKGTRIQQILISLIGIPVMVILNISRIFLVVIIGYYKGADLSLRIFHLFGGFIFIFVGMLLILFIMGKIYKNEKVVENLIFTDTFTNKNSKLIDKPILNKKYEIFKIILIMLIPILIYMIQIPIISIDSNEETISTISYIDYGESNITYLPNIDNYDSAFIYRDLDFEQISGQDRSLMYAYTDNFDLSRKYYVGIEIAETKGSLHPWEICLIEWPMAQKREPSVTKIDMHDIKLVDNPPIIARYFSYEDKSMDRTRSILYFYIRTAMMIDSEYSYKWIKVSIIKNIDHIAEIEYEENSLLLFASAILNHWDITQSLSWIIIIIADYSSSILISLLILLLISIGIYNYDTFLNKRDKMISYKNITNIEDKIILEIIKNNKISTFEQIEKILSKKLVVMDQDLILSKVKNAEKLGLIYINVDVTNNELSYYYQSIY